MKRASGCRQILVLIVFCAFCSGARSAGCSYALTQTKVAPSFTVNVLDYRDRPFGNVELVLTKAGKEVRRFKTEDGGKVVISDLSPGNYGLGPADPIRQSGPPNEASLVVSRDPGAQREVTLHWPAGRFISTTVLAGWLRAGVLPDDLNMLQRAEHEERLRNGTFGQKEVTPIVETEVELFRLPSRELVAKTKTDGFGYFDFPDVKQGMYYIRFKWDTYVEAIFLDLDPNVATSVPKLDIVIANVVICDNAPGYYSLSGKEMNATP